MSGDTNPYKEMIVNNAEKIEPLLAQVEQWSIFEQHVIITYSMTNTQRIFTA